MAALPSLSRFRAPNCSRSPRAAASRNPRRTGSSAVDPQRGQHLGVGLIETWVGGSARQKPCEQFVDIEATQDPRHRTEAARILPARRASGCRARPVQTRRLEGIERVARPHARGSAASERPWQRHRRGPAERRTPPTRGSSPDRGVSWISEGRMNSTRMPFNRAGRSLRPGAAALVNRRHRAVARSAHHRTSAL